MKGHTNNPNGRPRRLTDGDRKQPLTLRIKTRHLEWLEQEAMRGNTTKGIIIEALIEEKARQ